MHLQIDFTECQNGMHRLEMSGHKTGTKRAQNGHTFKMRAFFSRPEKTALPDRYVASLNIYSVAQQTTETFGAHHAKETTQCLQNTKNNYQRVTVRNLYKAHFKG